MFVKVHGDPGTAAAAVYDRLMHACARAYTLTHTQTDTQLCRGLKMEPQPQNTILSDPLLPHHDGNISAQYPKKLHTNSRYYQNVDFL